MSAKRTFLFVLTGYTGYVSGRLYGPINFAKKHGKYEDDYLKITCYEKEWISKWDLVWSWKKLDERKD